VNYADLIFFIGWPDRSLMRRLDDGASPAASWQHVRVPGEMRRSARRTTLLKAWVGEAAGRSSA
jgi:hypothetical protein